MDSFSAFARGIASQGAECMVFDWDEAARRIVATKPKSASAGLRDDWEWTGGPIFESGKIVPREETYTFLSSTWAVPELEMDNTVKSCYKMKSEVPDWDEHTYWPESALAILRGD